MSFYEKCKKIDDVITEIVLYKHNVLAQRKFSFGTWNSRQHVFIEIKTANHKGLAENIITTNKPDSSLDEWKKWCEQLKGKTVFNAFNLLRENIGVWSGKMTEMTEMAIIDLAGKCTGENALSMMGIDNTKDMHGVYVILSDDVDFVEKNAKHAVEVNVSKYIKVKLFGKLELDCNVIKAVRKYAPRENTFLIGDVNGGYCMKENEATIEEIAKNLNILYDCGLDACEDPAYITNDEWVQLQSLVGKLDLIPDYPMRPAKKAMETFLSGMGRIYNIHPGCSSSIIDAVELAKKIKSVGAKLMIGDDSLIGPSCSIWQQIAIGLQADWVEAIEKESDSDFYRECVINLPTDSSENPIKYNDKEAGFGILLDSEKMASFATEVVKI